LFSDLTEALQALYATASRARRSKIRSFCVLVEAFDGTLRFPTQIGERLGLQMTKALQANPGLAMRLKRRLQVAARNTPEEEHAIIQNALRGPRQNTSDPDTLAPGLMVQQKGKRLVLSGDALTPELQQDLLTWLRGRIS